MASNSSQKPSGHHANSASWSSSSYHDLPSATNGNGANLSVNHYNVDKYISRPRSRSENPKLSTSNFENLAPSISRWSSSTSSESSGADDQKKQNTPQSRFFPQRGLEALAESPEEYKSAEQHFSPIPHRRSEPFSSGSLGHSAFRSRFESMPNELAPVHAPATSASNQKNHIADVEDRSTPGGVTLTNPFKNPDGHKFQPFASGHNFGCQPTASYKPPHMRLTSSTLPGLHLNTSETMDDPFISDPFSAPPFARQQGIPQSFYGRATQKSDSPTSSPHKSPFSGSNQDLPSHVQESPYQPCLSQLPTAVAENMLVLLQETKVSPEKINNQNWSLAGVLQQASVAGYINADVDEKSFMAKFIAAHIMAGFAERSGRLPPQDGDPIKHRTASELKEGKQQRRARPEPEPQVQLPTLMPFDPGPCQSTAYLRSMINPGYSTLFGYLPFHDRCKITRPVTRGVVRLSDIPYNATRQEVIAFFGRNARLVSQPPGSPYYAIHIILERATAKSMDCYVEFATHADAVTAASRFTNPNRQSSRRPRIGDRAVKVAVVQQEELMLQLFPRAKCVQWNGQHPMVMTAQDQFSATFKGFVDSEEMHMLMKYAQNPSRSQSRFGAKHPQRVYENMISTLYKYPWWATDLYTVEERDRLFNTTRYLLSCLSEALRNSWHTDFISVELLQELLIAGLTAPGFSERQLAELCDAVHGLISVPRYVNPIAKYIPFNVLRRTENGSPELVQYYDYIFKSAASQVNYSRIPPEQAAAAEAKFEFPFGNICIDWPEGEERKQYAPMSAVAEYEMETIQWYLSIMANGIP